jgi:hypothetical protein
MSAAMAAMFMQLVHNVAQGKRAANSVGSSNCSRGACGVGNHNVKSRLHASCCAVEFYMVCNSKDAWKLFEGAQIAACIAASFAAPAPFCCAYYACESEHHCWATCAGAKQCMIQCVQSAPPKRWDSAR